MKSNTDPRRAAREKLKRSLAKRRKDHYGFHLSPAQGDGSKIEYIGESRAKFTFPCGHHETKDWGKGKISRQMPPESVQRFVRRWSRNGLHVHPCYVCLKKGIDLKAQTAVARQNMKSNTHCERE